MSQTYEWERQQAIAEATAAHERMTAEEEAKNHLWRKRFCIFLLLLAFATLCGAVKYWP